MVPSPFQGDYPCTARNTCPEAVPKGGRCSTRQLHCTERTLALRQCRRGEVQVSAVVGLG